MSRGEIDVGNCTVRASNEPNGAAIRDCDLGHVKWMVNSWLRTFASLARWESCALQCGDSRLMSKRLKDETTQARCSVLT